MRIWQDKADNTAPASTGVLTAGEDDARGFELNNAVLSSGIALDPTLGPDADFYMLAQAMARYASGGVFCQDGGAANAYVLTSPLAFRLPKAYFAGMMVMFSPANANSGAATVNVNGIGVKPVRTYAGAVLTGGEFEAGRLTCLVYDPSLNSGLGAFRIAPWAQVQTAAAELWKNAPVFPEINEAGGVFVLSNLGAGTLEIASGQSFVWRGWRRISTSDFLVADRRATTVANKNYHWVWYPPGDANAPEVTWPNGRYLLRDLADPTYNPSALAEVNAAFDTTYDRMLFARVTTDGSNVATIVPLANKARLDLALSLSATTWDTTDAPNHARGKRFQHSFNWSRRPASYNFSGVFYASVVGTAKVSGGANVISDGSVAPALSTAPPTVTRERFDAQVWTDWDSNPTGGWFAALNYSASA